MASEGHKRFRRIFDEFNMQRLAQGTENARNLKCISHGYRMFKNFQTPMRELFELLQNLERLAGVLVSGPKPFC